jgi:hypothetical protein
VNDQWNQPVADDDGTALPAGPPTAIDPNAYAGAWITTVGEMCAGDDPPVTAVFTGISRLVDAGDRIISHDPTIAESAGALASLLDEIGIIAGKGRNTLGADR